MKKLFSTFIGILVFQSLSAQFQIDAGAGLGISNNKTLTFKKIGNTGMPAYDTTYSEYKVSGSGVGLYVYPKLHIVELANHSLSVGIPVMLGASGSANSQTGAEESSAFWSIGLAVDLNGGRLNKKRDNSEKMIGYFGGIGVAYSGAPIGWDGSSITKPNPLHKDMIVLNKSESEYDYMAGESAGLLIHAGVVVPFLFNKESNKNMGLRFFAIPSFGKGKLTYFGATVFVSFGKSKE